MAACSAVLRCDNRHRACVLAHVGGNALHASDGSRLVIRGAIETAQDRLVSGWIYCKAHPLRDQLVLAFSGARCVGTGKVEIFRKDLADAGLGDGYCGFHFPVALEKGEHPASLVVRLADSDMALIQAGSRVGL